MKTKHLYGYIKEQFGFDVVEERRIYRYVNKEELSKKEKNRIPKEKQFLSYRQWKKYIVGKFSNFSKEGLFELSRLIKMLQRETKSNVEFNKNMYLSIPVIMMTLIVEKFVDYYTVDYTAMNIEGKVQMTIFLLLYVASIIIFSALVAWVLIHMNLDFVRVRRKTFFYDDIQEILSEMLGTATNAEKKERTVEGER